jgi:hypothetical protein
MAALLLRAQSFFQLQTYKVVESRNKFARWEST